MLKPFPNFLLKINIKVKGKTKEKKGIQALDNFLKKKA